MKLCYKEYEIKMDLGSMRKFHQATGKCLSSLMVSYINAYVKSKAVSDCTTVNRLDILGQVADFETASQALYCLIENDSVGLIEVQDAMWRSGLLDPVDADEMCQPWQLVVAMAAYEISQQQTDVREAKKKAVTSEQSTSK